MNVWDSSHSSKLSRYCHKYKSQKLTGAPNEIDALIASVNAFSKKQKIDVILGAGILGTFVLAKIKGKLTEAKVFPTPSTQQIKTLHNKWLLHQLLVKHGIPSPETRLIIDAKKNSARDMNFPIMLKPLALGNSEGVKKFSSHEEVDYYLSNGHSEHMPVLAQEFVPGKDLVFGFLANNGEITAWTLLERKPHFVRFFKNDQILDCARKIIAAIKFTGVANLDFRLDEKTGRFAVLECNPRFWASSPISVYYGVDFVRFGLAIAQGKEIEDGWKRGVDENREVPYPTPRRYLTGLITGKYPIRGSKKNIAWRALVDPFPTIKEIIYDRLHLLNIYDSVLMEKMLEEEN